MLLHHLSSIVWSIRPISPPLLRRVRPPFRFLQADVSVSIGDLTLIAAPQAVQVLAKLPDVFAELAPESTETTETVLGRIFALNLGEEAQCHIEYGDYIED